LIKQEEEINEAVAKVMFLNAHIRTLADLFDEKPVDPEWQEIYRRDKGEISDSATHPQKQFAKSS